MPVTQNTVPRLQALSAGLEMLLASPAAVQSALQRLCDGLLKEDPKVAALRATLAGMLAGTPPA